MEERGWVESAGKDGKEEDEGRAGQGLSVKKTAMKGNCHAPLLAQEHLSREEHAKCAGHVLTIPPLFYTKSNTHALAHTESLEKKGLLAPLSERHRLSDNMPVKLSLASSHMQGKVRLMKKNTSGWGGWSGKNH